jgi:AhpC/TSA family
MIVPALLLLSPPRIELRDQDGKLRPVFGRAKATVLVIGLLDCPIARAYVPELTRLHRRFSPTGVDWKYISVDSDASPKDLKQFARSYGLPFPALLDPKHFTVTLTGARAVPAVALFDANGTMIYCGRIDDRFPELGVQRAPRESNLRRAIEAWRLGKPPEPARTRVIGCAIPPLPSP